MTTVTNKVGGEIDAYCTKCKLELGHTILAMVGSRVARVRCNTCQGEHAYRRSAPGTASARKKASASPSKVAPRHAGPDLDALLEGRDTSQPHRYTVAELFNKGEVVDHPSFGLGVVVDVRGDRFDVCFRAGVKTLAQRKAVAVAAHRQETPRREPIEDPSATGTDENPTPASQLN